MSVLIQSRVEEADRNAANAVLNTLGLSMSDYLRMCVRRLAQDRALPKEFSKPNAATLSAMKELHEGGGKSFDSVATLMADLNADD